MKSRQKGISEIISIIILIAIVVSGTAVFSVFSQERILTNVGSVTEVIEATQAQTGELLRKIMISRNIENSTTYLFNYGFQNITITNVFMDELDCNADFYCYYVVSSADDKFIFNNTIPVFENNSTVKLFVNATFKNQVTLVTDTNNIFAIKD